MLPSRRLLLSLATRAATLAGAAEFFTAWFSAAQSHPHADGRMAPPESPLLSHYQPKFFEAADFAALQDFTEILIPADDTPGARQAHCAHYIDFVLQASAVHAPNTQKQWRDAMKALKDAGFHEADAKGRADLVQAMSKPERDRGARHPAFPAYLLIKQMNTFAFYTSRAGIIDTLDYRGNSYNESFPACTHPEHHTI